MSLSKDERKKQTKVSSQYVRPLPPRNPNKRPTKINMKRSIGRMESNNRDVIRQARIREYIKKRLEFYNTSVFWLFVLLLLLFILVT